MSDPRSDLSDELAFELPGGGHVLFTARDDGNMSSVGGVDHERGGQTRERLRTRLGLRGLARGYQVHGTTVRRIRREADIPDPAVDAPQPPVRADGHATVLRGVGVMALGADCLPVAIGGNGAVAMVHAGWRGLAAGALEEGVRAVGELGGDGALTAVVGPGAGACCYEVGPEVHATFDSTPDFTSSHPGTFAPGAAAEAADAKAASALGTIDLKSIARTRLLAAGVDRVDDVGMCTICDERFYSHRREGDRAGRQAGVAWIG